MKRCPVDIETVVSLSLVRGRSYCMIGKVPSMFKLGLPASASFA